MLNWWEILLSLVLIGMFMWSFVVLIITSKMIHIAKKVRGKCRFQDYFAAWTVFIFLIFSGITLFIYPGWIYNIPAVTICMEIGIGSLLFYISERQLINWKQFKLTMANKQHPLHNR